MTSPADELRAAAKELREYASTASPAPWAVNQWGNVETSGHEEMAEVWPLQADPGVNAAYIALMGPDVGHALVDLLGTAADMVTAYPQMGDAHDRQVCDDFACDLVGRALAVARALIGEAL